MKIFSKTIPVPTGTPTLFDCKDTNVRFPLSIAAHPGAGGSILVEASLHPNAANVGATGVIWFPWVDGTVTTDKLGSLVAPVSALRFTAATQAGTVELAS